MTQALELLSLLPVSNSKPLSTNVWQQPPAWSCCSRTKTLCPALPSNTAVVKPPIPLPTTIVSILSGTFWDLNPVRITQNWWIARHWHINFLQEMAILWNDFQKWERKFGNQSYRAFTRGRLGRGGLPEKFSHLPIRSSWRSHLPVYSIANNSTLSNLV